MDAVTVRERFTTALDTLVAQIKEDRSILAAILCGSLSHDTVWARSDIDLVLVTIDDRNVAKSDVSLYADGVNVHAFLMPRAAFRQESEGSLRQSFLHSLLARGRLLFAHDRTVADMFAGLAAPIGDRDTAVQLLRAATAALSPIYKAHKWFITRRDLDYTALWILYAATPLAQVEVIGARQLIGREVILQAMALNPSFFKTIYTDLLNAPKTLERVQLALEAVDLYIAERAPSLFRELISQLREVGEARACSEIEAHFVRTCNVHGVTTACEYLADLGILGKASTPVHLTKKSNIEVQELAFFYVRTQDDNPGSGSMDPVG